MVAGVHKHQIVIAIFDGASSFWRAAEALVDAGFGTEQIKFAGLEPILAELSAGRDRSPASLAIEVQCFGCDEQPEVAQSRCPEICCGRLAPNREDAGLAKSSIGKEQGASVLWPLLDFERQVHAGAVVLVVSPADIEQRRAATRILLKYSSEHVQTREFHAQRRSRSCSFAASVP
jgi:hypothetical protein